MRLKLFIHPKADSDFVALIHWLAVRDAENAQTFINSLQSVVFDLASRPENGIPLHFTDSNLGQVFSIGFAEFPVFRLFYRVVQKEIQILRLLKCPPALVKNLYQSQSTPVPGNS